VAIDDGLAVDYTAVKRGTTVYDSNEAEAGKIVEVLDNAREHIFDGVVVETPYGSRHFVDAPEVARTAERGVTLTITAEEVRRLPPPDKGSGPGGFLSRLLRR
jgi:uncharacterized protein with ATP-grasp and redox domains